MADDRRPGNGTATGRRVGWGFVSLYALAYLGTTLQLLAPVLVTWP